MSGELVSTLECNTVPVNGVFTVHTLIFTLSVLRVGDLDVLREQTVAAFAFPRILANAARRLAPSAREAREQVTRA